MPVRSGDVLMVDGKENRVCFWGFRNSPWYQLSPQYLLRMEKPCSIKNETLEEDVVLNLVTQSKKVQPESTYALSRGYLQPNHRNGAEMVSSRFRHFPIVAFQISLMFLGSMDLGILNCSRPSSPVDTSEWTTVQDFMNNQNELSGSPNSGIS